MWTFTALLVLTLLVQIAVWAMADLSARTAANHALQTARVLDGTAPAGHADATELLAALNPRGLTDVQVTVTRDAVTTVTVTGRALAVIPYLRLPVRATVQAPTEDPPPLAP